MTQDHDTPAASDELIAVARALADISAPILRAHYRAPLDIELKADETPVTHVDRKVEEALRAHLATCRPEDGIIGEEFGKTRPEADWQWVIDPIDGTRSFILGRPLFGTLIALLWRGQPLVGVIDMPITQDRWVGAVGRPTLFNGAPCRTRACAALGTAHLATTSPDLFTERESRLFASARDSVQETHYGGDCSNYGYLASGRLDLVIEAGLKLYDFAALVPIIEGAGGTMVDWSGRPLGCDSDGRVIAAGDARLVQALLS